MGDWVTAIDRWLPYFGGVQLAVALAMFLGGRWLARVGDTSDVRLGRKLAWRAPWVAVVGVGTILGSSLVSMFGLFVLVGSIVAQEARMDSRQQAVNQLMLGVLAGRNPRSHRLVTLLVDTFARPDEWLTTPNRQFGDRRPIDLVGTPEERKLLDVLIAAENGMF